MSKYVRYIIICLIIIAQPAAAQTPLSRNIWLNETNTNQKVNCLLQDNTGYLWVGTDDGLYRYNGTKFSYLETIGGNAITALANSRGSLMIGFADGSLGTWVHGVFEKKLLQGSIPSEAISSIHCIGNGLTFLSTLGDAVYIVHNNYCSRYDEGNGLPDSYVYTINFQQSNMAIIATDHGIQQINYNGQKVDTLNFTTANGLPDNIVRVISNMKDTCLSWIGAHQGGLALYCRKTQKVWTPTGIDKWIWGQINDILAIEGRRAWMCTEEGYLLNVTLNSNGSLSLRAFHYEDEKLYKLLMDDVGNIWCGTGTGLKNFPAEYLYAIKLPQPYMLQDVTAIACDEDNRLWIAQKHNLYYVSLNSTDKTLHKAYSFTKLITKIYNDEKNRIWVGTFGGGLWYGNGTNNFKKADNESILSEESILDITISGSELWVAGLNGVQEYALTDNTQLELKKLHEKSTGIGSDYVYEIFPDKRGNIWMATDGAGICMYHDGQYQHWDSADGINSTVCYNITEDVAANMWAGSFDKGLLMYKDNYWHNLNIEHGLSNLKITAIAPTRSANVLIVHGAGIDEWHKGSQQFRHYNRRLGLNVDSLSHTLNLTTTDKDGRVLIPYKYGMLCFDNYAYSIDIVPHIQITYLNKYFVEGIEAIHDLEHAENYITFKYEGINFTNLQKHYYRYKLVGYSDDWIYTMDESVTFAQLPGGEYTFVVQVSLNELFTAYGEDSYSFNIKKPYWLQWWFILLIVLVGWGMVVVYIRLRERNLKKLNQLQKERMMFEYEHLKTQVNPHFLFNSLNVLTGLIEDDSPAAADYTTRLSDLYRNMLSHKDKDLIWLYEEWHIVENYVYIQQSRFGKALLLDAKIPSELKKGKKVVPMALQILLENAIKHNVVSNDRPLVVRFEVDEKMLTVTNNYQPKKKKEKGAGLGLVNIKKRYALHTNREVVWYVQDEKFIVKIPLI